MASSQQRATPPPPRRPPNYHPHPRLPPPRSSTATGAGAPPTPTLVLFPSEDDDGYDGDERSSVSGRSTRSGGVSVQIDHDHDTERDEGSEIVDVHSAVASAPPRGRPPSPAISIDSGLDEPLTEGSQYGTFERHTQPTPTRQNSASSVTGDQLSPSPSSRDSSLPPRTHGFLHPDYMASTTTSDSPTAMTPGSSASGPTFTTRSTTPPPPRASTGPSHANPFNFQTQYITTSPVKPPSGGGSTQQRRGHRYKHSSISTSHNLIPLPPPRPPLALPASLPVPTLREMYRSTLPEQRARLAWCLCHAAVAVVVFFSGGERGGLATTALAHLVFFDAGSAAVCAAVDVLGNFEVWRRSSIRHPFGLARAEVLAGFAMSVFLVFGGFDLVSHDLKDMLERVGHHEPHHPHADTVVQNYVAGSGGHASEHMHGGGKVVAPGSVDLVALAAIISTLVSAYGLRNHAKVSRLMMSAHGGGWASSSPSSSSWGRQLLQRLPGVLANPFHFLTLSSAAVMLLLPLLSLGFYRWVDRLLCLAIAVSMFTLGLRLAVAQGLMLLMSYAGNAGGGGGGFSKTKKGEKWATMPARDTQQEDSAVSRVLREIAAEPGVVRVNDARFWQVHYGLCLASLRVVVARGPLLLATYGGNVGGNGGDDHLDTALAALRNRVALIVRSRLGGADHSYGTGTANTAVRWEVTVQVETVPGGDERGAGTAVAADGFPVPGT